MNLWLVHGRSQQTILQPFSIFKRRNSQPISSLLQRCGHMLADAGRIVFPAISTYTAAMMILPIGTVADTPMAQSLEIEDWTVSKVCFFGILWS